jgi:hypothetical protein
MTNAEKIAQLQREINDKNAELEALEKQENLQLQNKD